MNLQNTTFSIQQIMKRDFQGDQPGDRAPAAGQSLFCLLAVLIEHAYWWQGYRMLLDTLNISAVTGLLVF